jgi:hypothetical protein
VRATDYGLEDHPDKPLILVRSIDDVAAHVALGFTRIAVDSDLSILRKAYQTLVTGKA